jgi:hypothetical protein
LASTTLTIWQQEPRLSAHPPVGWTVPQVVTDFYTKLDKQRRQATCEAEQAARLAATLKEKAAEDARLGDAGPACEWAGCDRDASTSPSCTWFGYCCATHHLNARRAITDDEDDDDNVADFDDDVAEFRSAADLDDGALCVNNCGRLAGYYGPETKRGVSKTACSPECFDQWYASVTTGERRLIP